MSIITKLAMAALPIGVAVWLAMAPGASADDQNVARQKQLIEHLKPLHKPLGPVEPGDWLESHPERGQSFDQYREMLPVTPQGARRVIYVQPIGAFGPEQTKIVELTAEFLSRYYDRPVRVRPSLALEIVPDAARRHHPDTGAEQLLTSHLLKYVLKPRLPRDAAAMIGFTASDLWPGEGWNFVFGQASLSDRVGVWSIHRYGDPAAGKAEFQQCLLRALKVAAHETGHMFTIEHCTQYECNMCGSNSLAESDRRPIEVCPECLAKICWATDCDPAVRFRKLAEFCEQHSLEREGRRYRELLQAVGR